MTDFQAIIFDYDGTLVNLRATPFKMDALRADVRNCFGECATDLAFRPFYHDIDVAIARVAQWAPQALTTTRAQLNAIIQSYEADFSEASEAKPFAREVWRAAIHKWRVGIVSNNAASYIRPTLERHQIALSGDRFVLVGFEDVERHKPYPDSLSRIAQLLGLTKGQRAIYIGDHYDDLEACHRFNAGETVDLLPFVVEGGKCDWQRVVAHPYFHESTSIANLSGIISVLSNVDQADVKFD